MKKKLKYLLTFVLAFALLLSGMPGTVAKAEETEYFTLSEVMGYFNYDVSDTFSDEYDYIVFTSSACPDVYHVVVRVLAGQEFSLVRTQDKTSSETIVKYGVDYVSASGVFGFALGDDGFCRVDTCAKSCCVCEIGSTSSAGIKYPGETFNYVYSNFSIVDSEGYDDMSEDAYAGQVDVLVDEDFVASVEAFYSGDDGFGDDSGAEPTPEPTATPVPDSGNDDSSSSGGGSSDVDSDAPGWLVLGFLDLIPIILSLFTVFPLNVFLGGTLVTIGVIVYRRLKRS